MSKLSDEKLVKRATHAGRNLAILAILVSIVAIGATLFAVWAKNVSFLMMGMPILSFIFIATGYWLLAVAAKRGNPNAVGTVIVLMGLQLTFVFISHILAAAGSGEDRPLIPGLVIPLLVIIALANSRNVLLDLRKRGLWNQIFGDAKPSARLFVSGSVLLVVGFIGINGSQIYMGGQVRQVQQIEMQQAQRFLEMIETEELAFMEAMGALSGTYGVKDVEDILAKVTALEHKVMTIEASIDGTHSLGSIVRTYGNAVRLWKNAIILLNDSQPDLKRVQQMLEMGDKLRLQSFHDFDRQYVTNH